MDESNQSGDRPIITAAKNGDMACLDILLAHRVGPGHDESCFLSQSPLSAAAGEGHVNLVKRLLIAGADPEYKAYTTALASAADSGSLECLMVVLEALGHGKDKKPAKALDSTMPLLNAALGAHTDCVEAILNAGSPSDLRSGLSSADMFYLNRTDVLRAQAFVDCTMEAKVLGRAVRSAKKMSSRKTL